MKTSFVFSGSGGQGVMSAGITLATTAISMGKHATYLPEYGPEQRGGSAKCTVVISDDEIISPLPKLCDNLIVMNEQAYEKFEFDVKEGGNIFANSSRIASLSRDDCKVINIPVDDIAHEAGNDKTANIVILGALIGETNIVTKESLINSLSEKFKEKGEKVLKMNIEALDKGINSVK